MAVSLPSQWFQTSVDAVNVTVECGAGSGAAGVTGRVIGTVVVNNRPSFNGTRVVALQMPFRGVRGGERVYVPILANSVYATASWQLQVDADAGFTISSISVDSSRWTLQSGVQNGGRRIVANAILAQEDSGVPQVRSGLEELGQVVVTVDGSASGTLGLRCTVLFLESVTERNVVQPGTAARFVDRNNRGGNISGLPTVGYSYVVQHVDVGVHVGFSRGAFVTELINTAVFSGVSQASSVFAMAVSTDGTVRTLSSGSLGCTSLNDNAVHVSHQCTSVYINGTETEAARRTGVVFWLDTSDGRRLSSHLNISVWAPELPVTILMPIQVCFDALDHTERRHSISRIDCTAIQNLSRH